MNKVVYRAANYKCTICGTFFSSIEAKPQCPKCGSLGQAVMIKIRGNSK